MQYTSRTAGHPTGSENTGDITVKLLVIVNESPWGSGLALAASRFVQAALEAQVEVSAVFFREDGIYHLLEGETTDAGTHDLAATWSKLSVTAGVRLLLCRSSRQRRLAAAPASTFEESGLTEMFEMMLQSDRVVTF